VTIAVVALSGRALAAAARRAGDACHVIDFFADDDTRALAQSCTRIESPLADGFAAAPLREALSRLGPSGIVYGAGFEVDPTLLRAMRDVAPLLGNPPETVAAVKHPLRLAETLRSLGLPHPETQLAAPTGEGWLRKRIGGSGGAHIERCADAIPDRYFQQCVSGRPASALFVADGHRASIVGFSAQWSDPAPGQPFRYGGCVTPAGLGAPLESRLADACDALARVSGLRGLNSLDLLVDGGDFRILEINPRPGATLDIFDGFGDLRLWRLHLAGVQGVLPGIPATPSTARAAAVVYAPRRIVVGRGFAWPDWAVDRSPAGSVIADGDPVCTVLAQAATARGARLAVDRRAARILTQLDGD
jgi:predicted ATP-grasp superfamily ATP-dependent carboligase